jgi:predicted nucleic acid-binding protein
VKAPVVVLDTKTLLRAYAFPGGACSELLDRAISRQISAVVPPCVLSELASILSGPLFFLPAHLVSAWVDDLRGICAAPLAAAGASATRVPAAAAKGPRTRSQDSELLSFAAAVRADHIVTGDARRLHRRGTSCGIRVDDPASFLLSLGEAAVAPS